MDHKKTGRHADTQSAAAILSSSTPPALDHNTISSTTSKRQSAAHPRMITIRGTSDHHHLESVITIGWNDRSPSLECPGHPHRCHGAKIGLRNDVALVCCPLIPSRKVLRHSLAFGVDDSKANLSVSVSLVGKRTQDSQRSRIVTKPVGEQAIFAWPCGYQSCEAESKNGRSDGRLQRAIHNHAPRVHINPAVGRSRTHS